MNTVVRNSGLAGTPWIPTNKALIDRNSYICPLVFWGCHIITTNLTHKYTEVDLTHLT